MADFRLGRLKFNWRGAWAASTAYVIDDIVSFKGNTYVCVVNHTSAASESLWASTDLNIATPRWQLHVPGTRIMGAWQPNTFYATNDLVSFGANQYLCVTNHTSPADQVNFYDPSIINNWSLYTSSTEYKGDWSAGVFYKLNDVVKYGNTLYNTTVPHTSGINFDPSKFSVYLESINFEDTWGAGTEYQPGDIVNFGGYTYVALTINTNKQPNAYLVDIVDQFTGDVTPADWQIVTTGFDVKGVYDNTLVYVPGDLVQFGGDAYVKIVTGAAGVYPIDQTAWTKVSSGLNWRGPWDSTATYQVNDVVSKQSASWVCLTPHNINIDPVADGGTNWQAVAQGESTLTLQDPGDILYRNNAGANVNLPIGTEGQILTVDAQGLPAWERNNLCANVFYVATDGTDDPDYGKNISKPWRTVRYALSQLPTGSATNINTIFVKSGTYQEQLPLTVPEYTSIVGDNLRATVIAPDPNTSSTDPTPVENRFSTMFVLSESTTLKDMIFSGMEGFEPAGGVDDYDITQATVRGVFLRLNPNTPILGKSPYITQCSAFSGRPIGTAANCTGGVGAIIDKAIYGQTTSNGSMLFDSFTQFHDLGVGFWCKDLGNAEIVSSFTYYCQIGYTCTGGGRIRSLVGNNSWGTYGAVSIGYDVNELPVTGNVRGQRLNFLYDENSALFVQDEEVVQGVDNGVVDQSWTASAGTTLVGQASTTYSGVASTSNGAGTGATFDVARDASGDISTITAVTFGSGYAINEVLTIDGSLIGGVTSTDDVTLALSAVADDFSVSNANYARALILYVQSDYLIIEAITGTFTEDKPITGDGSANVTASGATARTAAGGATPALEGVKGKIFPLTNLPVDLSNNPIFPRPTGATQFLNVVGNNAYDDSGSYVIKEVVDPSSASNLFISALRRYDVPGAAPDELTIIALSRSNNVATITTSAPHGLSTGDEVTIVIANTSNDIEGFATGYDANDDLVLGIRSGVLQRTVITEVSGQGSQFTYANTGSDITISAAQGNNGLITGSIVYKQGTSGGNTKQLHLGGSAVDLYNVSTSSTRLSPSGVAGIDSSTTSIAFADSGLSLLDTYGGSIAAGANNYLMINNELMRITATNDQGCVVARGKEGTTAAAHAEGSIIYYVQKSAASTTLRSDVDTAVTDIPLFSISNFDTHDMARIGAVLDPQTGETSGGEYFKITSVNSPNIGRATIIFAQPKNINANSGQAVEIRLRYSQVRMTGHDFLQVGTGSKAQTNWPNQPLQEPDQAKETKEDLPGRVYYVSSDQDGNFRVGEFFTVEQATGTATLDASAFNLAGLASLRLGTLGAELGVAINEFSSDKTLGGDFARDSAVATQLAVKTYVDNSVGAGINRSAPLIGVQSLTSSGTTATVSAYVAPNVYAGDYVLISGADQANYNGLFLVNAIDEANNSFTYVMGGTAVSPATGAITVERKQRISSDLEIEGLTEVTPTWNGLSDLNALVVNVTDTQSTNSSSLIKASIANGVNAGTKFLVDKSGNLTISGNLTVSGTTTTINSTTLSIDDKEVVIADGADDLTKADGAGITLGTSGLSFKYENSTTRWNLPSAALNVGSTSGYYIGGTSVLSSTTLGANITGSSLTSLGTLSALNVSGASAIGSVTEKVSIRTANESSNQTYTFGSNNVFYHPSIGGAITPDIDGVPTTAQRSFAVVMIVNQGAAAHDIGVGNNGFGINGSPFTVQWPDGTAPTPTANQKDIYTFTLVNTSTSNGSPVWQVFGSKSSFA
jgi:hypothetical protein